MIKRKTGYDYCVFFLSLLFFIALLFSQLNYLAFKSVSKIQQPRQHLFLLGFQADTKTMNYPKSNPYKVAVIGYGFSAKVFQIPFICSDTQFELHAILQRHATENNDAGQDFPNIKIYRELQDVLQDAEVDVVIVSTPPSSHYDIAFQALHARKHGMFFLAEIFYC